MPIVLLSAISGSSCSSPPAPKPSGAFTIRAPASIVARVCTRCGSLVGDLEVAVDLVVEETAGVGGSISQWTMLLEGSGGSIEGPGTFGPSNLLQFGAPTTRVGARGSVTLPEIGLHFPPSALLRLPGTLRFTFTFLDDNGHTMSVDVSIRVTAS
jgi:hypothetical protein